MKKYFLKKFIPVYKSGNKICVGYVNKETYINTNLLDKNVIVLGDFNDDILSGSPFSNFISDDENYLFVDMEIAKANRSGWSCPSWPSHLDHILVTNELADKLESVETLQLDIDLNNYEKDVSDHRPVSTTFSN